MYDLHGCDDNHTAGLASFRARRYSPMKGHSTYEERRLAASFGPLSQMNWVASSERAWMLVVCVAGMTDVGIGDRWRERCWSRRRSVD